MENTLHLPENYTKITAEEMVYLDERMEGMLTVSWKGYYTSESNSYPPHSQYGVKR